MKLIAFAVVVALAGCKKSDPVVTTGSGSSGSGSAIVVVAPDAAIAPADAAPAPCVIVVKLQIGKLSWDGGGITGNTDYKPGEVPHIDAMKAAPPTCVVFFSAANDLKYQDVISVIDAIVKIGLVDVQLGRDGDKVLPKQTTRPQPNMDIKWAKGADGKLALTGTIDKMSGNAPLATAPVLIISKTEVVLGADAARQARRCGHRDQARCEVAGEPEGSDRDHSSR